METSDIRTLCVTGAGQMGSQIALLGVLAGIETSLLADPRYRQRLAFVPWFDHPVWVDDPRFELDYHIRHRALPKPGSRQQLQELAASSEGRASLHALDVSDLSATEALATGLGDVPLDAVVERGALDPVRAARIVRDLAEGLTAVHDQGVLHAAVLLFADDAYVRSAVLGDETCFDQSPQLVPRHIHRCQQRLHVNGR